MRTKVEIIRLTDMVAAIRREMALIPPSACQVLFDQENIPEGERSELRSLICSELGRRGGSQPKKPRPKKARKYSAKEILSILAEARWQIIMEGARANEKFLMERHTDP